MFIKRILRMLCRSRSVVQKAVVTSREAMIEANEKVIRECGSRAAALSKAHLFEDREILCHWSKPFEGGEYMNYSHEKHGLKPAVLRRDMRWPTCRSCMIEDPYE